MGLGLVSMTCTSEDRIEMAAKLRQIADEHDAIHAFSNADIQYIANLIDPTCEVSSVETYNNELGQLEGWEFHLTCGHSVQRPWNEPPAYCPECGARVVSDNDK